MVMLPPMVDFFDGTFVCEGSSTRNRNRVPLVCGWDKSLDANMNLSSRTLNACLWVLRRCRVRSFRLENPGGCDFKMVPCVLKL